MFNYLFSKKPDKNSASVAKKRLLQVIVSEAHHQEGQHSVDLQLLQSDLLKVLSKYYDHIDPEQVKVELERESNYSVLELNITLPDSDQA